MKSVSHIGTTCRIKIFDFSLFPRKIEGLSSPLFLEHLESIKHPVIAIFQNSSKFFLKLSGFLLKVGPFFTKSPVDFSIFFERKNG